MAFPRLFFGAGGSGALFEAGVGTDDAGGPLAMRARTVRVAPAGASGECIFTALVLVVTHSMAATLRVTPIIDGDSLAASAHLLTLTATGGARVTERFELGLSIPLLDAAAVERSRFALRGCWLAVQVESEGALGAGDLLVEVQEVEFEVVQESLAAAMPNA